MQKTRAYHRLQDDVPTDVKKRRLEQLIATFREEAARANTALVGQAQVVLVEGVSGPGMELSSSFLLALRLCTAVATSAFPSHFPLVIPGLPRLFLHT